jgi:hypothetical protein
MGFLTMMCDYGVEFGWGFELSPQQPGLVQVDVQAYLSLRRLFKTMPLSLGPLV